MRLYRPLHGCLVIIGPIACRSFKEGATQTPQYLRGTAEGKSLVLRPRNANSASLCSLRDISGRWSVFAAQFLRTSFHVLGRQSLERTPKLANLSSSVV